MSSVPEGRRCGTHQRLLLAAWATGSRRERTPPSDALCPLVSCTHHTPSCLFLPQTPAGVRLTRWITGKNVSLEFGTDIHIYRVDTCRTSLLFNTRPLPRPLYPRTRPLCTAVVSTAVGPIPNTRGAVREPRGRREFARDSPRLDPSGGGRVRHRDRSGWETSSVSTQLVARFCCCWWQ